MSEGLSSGSLGKVPPALNIGVAREIKPDEYRVALTPAGALELTRDGHSVVVETGAGVGSAVQDSDYEAVGARIGSVEEVWESELVLKVKEPVPEEYPRIRDGQILFTYLHLAASEELTRALMESGAACVAYETVETDDRALPLLAPMSEIAGRLASQAGATFLERPLGGRGLLLGGVPGVAPGEVVIIGGGMVGYNAAVIALGLGATVTILERSIDRMRRLEEILGSRAALLMSSSLQIQESITQADVVVGAVLIPGALAPKLITREMVAGMKEGSVIADVAIDQGGCVETSHPTTHSEPVFVVEGVVHYCVANMPGAVPITSTKALTNATIPYVEEIAAHGLRDAIARDPALARGVNVLDGKITYEAVAEAHDLDYTPLEDVLRLSPV
jgi:alanine dehydrogenase